MPPWVRRTDRKDRFELYSMLRLIGDSGESMQKFKDEDDDVLPAARAKAQSIRERELLELLGVTRQSECKRVGTEVNEMIRIIESDRAAVALKSVNAAERKLLKKQIERRTARLDALRQRLESLKD
jgi:hypothetical protein